MKLLIFLLFAITPTPTPTPKVTPVTPVAGYVYNPYLYDAPAKVQKHCYNQMHMCGMMPVGKIMIPRYCNRTVCR